MPWHVHLFLALVVSAACSTGAESGVSPVTPSVLHKAQHKLSHEDLERRWEANAHQDLIHQMRIETADLDEEAPAERHLAKSFVKPLRRLGGEMGQLDRKEQQALEQETFIEKQVEHIEDKMERRLTPLLGEGTPGGTLEGFNNVKTGAVKRLKRALKEVRNSEIAAAEALRQKAEAHTEREKASTQSLHQELAFMQNEASSLDDLGHAAAMESSAIGGGKRMNVLARKVAKDAAKVAAKFQQEVQKRRAPLLGEGQSIGKKKESPGALETHTLKVLKAKQAEVKMYTGMEGEAIEVAARANDAALEAEQQQSLSGSAMKQVAQNLRTVAHHMLARAGMRHSDVLGEPRIEGPSSMDKVVLRAEKQIALNAEHAKDRMVIKQAVVAAKRAAAEKLAQEKSEMTKENRKARLESKAIKSERMIEGEFVQQLQAANGALRRGEDDEQLAHTSAADVQQQIKSLISRIHSSDAP